MRELWRGAAIEGATVGAPLAAAAVIFGVLGLTPSLHWIPDGPLLTFGVAVAAVGLGIAGYLGARRTAHFRGGALAGEIAGLIFGLALGITYIAFGKPVFNLIGGPAAGAAFGVIFGSIGASIERWVGASSTGGIK